MSNERTPSWDLAYWPTFGPVPCRADHEVALFIEAVVDARMELRLEPGLVMRITGKHFGMWFVTFYVTNDGTHRFYEMSGTEMVFTGSHPNHGPDQTADALRFLRAW